MDVDRLWPLLLPVSYLAHLAEEAWGGPGFVAWAARHLSPDFTRRRFAAVNSVAWPAVLLVALIAILRPAVLWPLAVAAAVLVVNGAVHLISSVVTASYAPGLVTGLLFYLPAGGFVLLRAARGQSAAWIAVAIAVALGLHALVVIVALGSRRRSRR